MKSKLVLLGNCVFLLLFLALIIVTFMKNSDENSIIPLLLGLFQCVGLLFNWWLFNKFAPKFTKSDQ